MRIRQTELLKLSVNGLRFWLIGKLGTSDSTLNSYVKLKYIALQQTARKTTQGFLNFLIYTVMELKKIV